MAIRSLIAQRRSVYVAVIILTFFGVIALVKLPLSVYPNLQFDSVDVHVQNSQLPPSQMRTSISDPLERVLSSVLGVRHMVAKSTQGQSNILVSFNPRVADINTALQRASTAVATVQSQLPVGTTLRIQPMGTDLYPVISYALTSKRLSPMQLRELAQYTIDPQLIGLPGVSFVRSQGGALREYWVSVHPQRLAASGVTILQVMQAIQKTNVINSVGFTENGYIRSNLLASGLAYNASDIANIPVATVGGSLVTVGSVATVSTKSAPVAWHAGNQGQDAVVVSIFPQPGASFVTISQGVSAKFKQAMANVQGVHVVKFWDQSTLVEHAVSNLRNAILVGLVLSTLVLIFFLRNWREAVVAALIIPLTIIAAFGFMGLLHLGLNLATLGGLAVGVGLIIDDAIVVVENIHRHLGQGEDRQTAVQAAIAEIAAPMISSTLTTIVVFLPLMVVSGIPGVFFKSLSATLTIALVLSLVLALAFTPSLALELLRPQRKQKQQQVSRAEERYESFLRRALRRKGWVWLTALGLMAVTVFFSVHLGTGFLPSIDEGALEMEIRFPPGTSFAESVRQTNQMEAILHQNPAVAASADLTGVKFPLSSGKSTAQNIASIRATLIPKSQRAPVDVVIKQLRRRIKEVVPDAKVGYKQLLQDMLGDLSNIPAPIEVIVYGPQQSVLKTLAQEVAGKIRTVHGVNGVFSGVFYENPSVVVQARPDDGNLGVSPAELMADEKALYDGQVVSQVIRYPLTIPIRVRYDLPLDPTLTQVEDTPFVTASGAVSPMYRLANFVQAPPESDIREINGRQCIAVTSQISGSNLGAIISGIRTKINGIPLPPGYSMQIAGAYLLQKKAFSQIALAITLSVTLVFFVMLVQFRSFLQPLVILTAVPLALFGASLALFLTHINLNVSSLMGVILLVGLVVKNGILLLEYTARMQQGGAAVADALVSAARIRLRPIVMTTLTALLGMLPLAFNFGSGSEMLQPLAIAVVGGLAFSTLVTLVMMPVFYATFSRENLH